MKNNVQAIILAAGKSTRFNSEQPKLAELICGQPIILSITQLLQSLNIETSVVIGHEKEIIKDIITSYHGDTIIYAEQKQQLGTGHALACSQHLWHKENILVINGDMPLITEQTISDLYAKHHENNASISFVTACSIDKTVSKGYGRVVVKNNKIEIIEAKDFVGDQTELCCLNAGIYIIKKDFLDSYITTLKNNNASNEFYITDLIKIASENNEHITRVTASFDTIRGINTIEELMIAEHIKQTQILKHWVDNGVRFASMHTVHVDTYVTIGHGSYISQGVHLRGKTSIGKNSTIASYSSLENTQLEDNVHIPSFCIIKNSSISTNTHIEPFTYVHNNDATIESKPIMSNFVEMKNITLDKQKEHPSHDIHSQFSFTAARLAHHDIPFEEQ